MGDNQFDPNAPYGQPQDAGQQNPQGFDPNAQYQQPGFDPNAQYQQPGFDPNAQYQQPGFNPNAQYQQPGFDPNAQYQQPGFDPNAQYQQGYDPNAQFSQQTAGRPAPYGNFVEVIRQDPIRICAYIGCLFLLLSSFMPRWVYVKVSFMGISESAGEGLFRAGGGILKLYAILFMILAICGILVEFGSYLPSLNNIAAKFKALPFSQFYIPCAAFIVWLLCVFNGTFRDTINSVKDASGYLGDAAKSGYGFVMWMCLIGIILLLVRPVMAIINKKPQYWD